MILLLHFFFNSFSVPLLVTLVRQGSGKMVSQSLLLKTVAATLALARTPSGFAPESNTDLIVEYGGISADNGVVVSKQSR